jgi:hypothetical protein
LADVKRPGQFERTIQALIGTGVITLLVSGIETACLHIGARWFVLGEWTSNTETASGIALATLLGLALAYASIRGPGEGGKLASIQIARPALMRPSHSIGREHASSRKSV